MNRTSTDSSNSSETPSCNVKGNFIQAAPSFYWTNCQTANRRYSAATTPGRRRTAPLAQYLHPTLPSSPEPVVTDPQLLLFSAQGNMFKGFQHTAEIALQKAAEDCKITAAEATEILLEKVILCRFDQNFYIFDGGMYHLLSDDAINYLVRLDVYGHVTDQMKHASAARMDTFIKAVLNL